LKVAVLDASRHPNTDVARRHHLLLLITDVIPRFGYKIISFTG